ncbi:hypothetical protein GDO81_013111 [Engystomops pustulosus]|uniref:Uncharacterized protein n=1 Tax=Engystomops pustulosus TaxID=76066 RepID=A0AAV7AY49_ENGPU|nr:hypothetical protein GDO81_013111 [Engystomops pustulosus]
MQPILLETKQKCRYEVFRAFALTLLFNLHAVPFPLIFLEMILLLHWHPAAFNLIDRPAPFLIKSSVYKTSQRMSEHMRSKELPKEFRDRIRGKTYESCIQFALKKHTHTMRNKILWSEETKI